MSERRPTFAATVAKQAWKNDGKPTFERDEPTSVGRLSYENWANVILRAADDAGYTLISADALKAIIAERDLYKRTWPNPQEFFAALKRELGEKS